MKHTTQKELKRLVSLECATDLTKKGFDFINKVRDSENGFEVESVSIGLYGLNGALLVGRKTGTLYAVCKRSSALAQLV